MSGTDRRAVVFAYSGVGVRCLAALLASGVDVPLVVTHEDAAGENIWFDSVAALATLNDIPVVTPKDPNGPQLAADIAALAPDFIFSFYYRRLLGQALLDLPARGAFNMHGSLLPKYRGRAPVNWAILKGETETGASLHRMVGKPDAGALVDQQAVPILPNDTAGRVYDKVACAAEQVLRRSLPALMAGTAIETPLDLAAGSYYGGRRPEDGRIDWREPAQAIHNLVRAVAPPWPGAFFDMAVGRVFFMGSHYRGESASSKTPAIYWQDGALYADCADGRRFRVLSLQFDGKQLDEGPFRAIFGGERLEIPG